MLLEDKYIFTTKTWPDELYDVKKNLDKWCHMTVFSTASKLVNSSLGGKNVFNEKTLN